MTTKPTHAELCETGKRWLIAEGYRVVIIEPAKRLGEQLKGEIPDVIGWRNAFDCAVIECKVSDSDKRADALKPHRRQGARAIGRRRLMLTGPDVKDLCVPDRWGHLTYADGYAITADEGEGFGLGERDTLKECGIALTAAYRNQMDQRAANPGTKKQTATLAPKTLEPIMEWLAANGPASAKEIPRDRWPASITKAAILSKRLIASDVPHHTCNGITVFHSAGCNQPTRAHSALA